MARLPVLRRGLLLALTLLGIGVVIAACGDSVSGPDREPGTILRSGSCPPGVACLPGVVVTAESSEGDCDPFDWSCGSDPCAADPWSCSDPCSVDPWAPGCGNDECSMGYYVPGCPDDPCTYDPYACGGDSGGTGETATPTTAPPGVEQSAFEQLNDTEKRMCWSSPRECYQVYTSKNTAESWAAQQTSVGAHNGPQDALRHAMWNAEMTKAMGADRAKAWADAHELSSTDPAETRMDLHNNAVGRTVGQTWANNGEGVLDAWRTGKLCTAVGSC